MTECSICAEPFTAVKRRAIGCPNTDCGHAACLACLKRWLAESDQAPHCMSCRSDWPEPFLAAHFPATFIKGPLRAKAQERALRAELASAPEVQQAAAQWKQARALDQSADEISCEMSNMRRRLAEMEDSRWAQQARASELREAALEDRPTPEDRGRVGRPCAHNDCRGFTDRHTHRCEMCERYTCKECYEPLARGAETPTCPEGCDPSCLASALALRATTKQCPGCGTSTFKTEGCDQMWCTQCHAAWSWRTGRRERGVIHNPHYYEYLADRGERLAAEEQAGHAPEHPAQLAAAAEQQIVKPLLAKRILCGDDETVAALLDATSASARTPEMGLGALVRAWVHVVGREIPRTAERAEANNERNQRLRRVRYVAGDLSAEELGKTAADAIQECRFWGATLAILTVWADGVRDLLRGMVEDARGTADAHEITEWIERMGAFRAAAQHVNRAVSRGAYRPAPPAACEVRAAKRVPTGGVERAVEAFLTDELELRKHCNVELLKLAAGFGRSTVQIFTGPEDCGLLRASDHRLKSVAKELKKAEPDLSDFRDLSVRADKNPGAIARQVRATIARVRGGRWR